MTHEEKAREIVEQHLGYICVNQLDKDCPHCESIKFISSALASAEKKGRDEILCTRVAELTQLYDGMVQNHKNLVEVVKPIREEREELRKRMEKALEMLYVAELENQAKMDLEKLTEAITLGSTQAEEYDHRLSALMKASEGMEKALEMLYSELVESNSPRCDEWSTPAKIIKQALADFRAVKENMEKGAGK